MKDIKKQYRYDSPGFEYDQIEKDQSTRKQKVETYQESNEVKFEHIYQQLMNDMYEDIDNGKCFKIAYIEKLLIKSMLSKYNRTQSAKLLGVCVRTLRSKINKYGFQNIQCNNTILQ